MPIGRFEFSIRDWKNTCPLGLETLKEHLVNLEHSKTLYQMLDNLIICIEDINNAATTKNDAVIQNYLQYKPQACLQLAALLTDTPNITYEELLTIRAKRRIDPLYLPKHLPGWEPWYIPLKRYAEIEESSVLEPHILNQKKELISKVELVFQKINRKRRAKEFFKKDRKLLFLSPTYFQSEALVKTIKQDLERPKLGQAKEFLHRIGDELEKFIDTFDFEDTLKAEIFQKIAAELENINTKYDAITNASLEEEDRLLLEPVTMVEVKTRLLSMLKPPTDKNSDKTLRYLIPTEQLPAFEKGVRKIIGNAVGKLEPRLALYYWNFWKKNPNFFSEQLNSNLRTKYLTAEEREPYRVLIHAGRLYRKRLSGGTLCFDYFSTNDDQFHSHKKKRWMTFVMNARGEMFAHSHSANNILHSSFMSGGPVLFAGEMKVADDGSILAISNYSGHYQPTFESLQFFARHLHQRGVDISKCSFHSVDAEVVQGKLDQVRMLMLPRAQKQKAEKALEKASQKLKFCKRYHFVNGQLVEVSNNNNTLKYVGLAIFMVLGLAFIIGVIVVSQGAAVPILAPLLLKFAAITSPVVAYGISVVVGAFVALVPSVVTAKMAGAFTFVANTLKSLGNWLSGRNQNRNLENPNGHTQRNIAPVNANRQEMLNNSSNVLVMKALSDSASVLPQNVSLQTGRELNKSDISLNTEAQKPPSEQLDNIYKRYTIEDDEKSSSQKPQVVF